MTRTPPLAPALQYVRIPRASKLVFDSEALENFPSGGKAREIYDFVFNDEFTETFELGGPGKELEVYVKDTFKRVKP